MQLRLMWAFWIVLVVIGTNHGMERIIGGSDAPEGKSPWAVFIRGYNREMDGNYYCGGTIISDRWMISAAHCFWGFQKPEDWFAQVGSNNVELTRRNSDNRNVIGYGMQSANSSEGGMRNSSRPTNSKRRNKIWEAKFKNIILHPKYDPDHKEYDIALIEIIGKFPLHARELSIANLPRGLNSKQWPMINSSCTLVGWGCLVNLLSPSPKAQVISLNVISNPVCTKRYGSKWIPDKSLCADHYKSSAAICDGDSGSGLICMHDQEPILAGVAASSDGVDPTSYPSVFTRVSSFTDWIFETIKATG